jgi:hypothetical protein
MKKEMILFFVFLLFAIILLVVSVDYKEQSIAGRILDKILGDEERSQVEDLPFGSELFTKEPYLAVLRDKKSLSWLLLTYLLIVLAFIWFFVIRKRKKMIGDTRSEMKVKMNMKGS